MEDGNDEEFEDMMDQLLERDGGGPAEIIAEALEQQLAPGLDSSLDDTHHDSQVSLDFRSSIELSRENATCQIVFSTRKSSEKFVKTYRANNST